MAKRFELKYESLVLELTRRCNMSCAHCLRGDAQALDMSKEIIRKALKNVKSISSLTLSGGEIALVPELIEYTLQTCIKNDIDVYNIYAVTNGKVVPDSFLLALIHFHAYTAKCNNGEFDGYSAIALSIDDFHEEIPDANKALIESLSFFAPEDHQKDFAFGKFDTLIDMGRAKTLLGYEKRSLRVYMPTVEFDEYDKSFWVEGFVYVTAKGDYLKTCDCSYDTQDEYKIGSIDDYSWLYKLAEKKIDMVAN